MAAVMLYAVLGGHSPTKCLLGAVVLIIGSIAFAPFARRSVAMQLHLVDYWAMAVAMLVLLPHRELIDSPNSHDHGGGLPAGGLPLFLAICGAWLLARAVFAIARRDARGRSSVFAAALTVAGFAVMYAFCR
jgi:hypothetical protein